ncbi:hypothetical protein ACFVAV_33405 [Nocardia sp. NPDC057663]|uniref:hypothetical protein n=1 Tax=Nocardia sp. NPDC057663 TaxID=3346201 RepID=UPI00366CB33C
MADDNPFSAYFTAPESTAPSEAERPRREAEPQTIGTTPETWPPLEPEADDDDGEVEQDVVADAGVVDDGYTGDWNDWNTELPAADATAQPGDEVDWDDWATTTATEQSGDYVPTPTLPRLTDYGGGGKVARRPRRNYDDERFDGDRGKTRIVAAVGGIVGAVALVAVVGAVATAGGDDPTTPGQAGTTGTRAATATTTAAPLPAHALPGCESFRSSSITISAEPGDTSTPQGAILGFEYSYFVDRSAVKARTFVTGDAQVGNDAALAIGIAGLPQDVRYCVHITRGDAKDPAVWDVTVRQQWPEDLAAEKVAYLVRTAEVSAGRFLITSIGYK